MWRARKWRKLLNLINQLPSHSLYMEAMANDEELARAHAGDPQPEHKERLSNWTPEIQMLASIVDRLGSVMSILVQVNGGTAHRIPPLPRPVTEFQRARERDAQERFEEFIERMEAKE